MTAIRSKRRKKGDPLKVRAKDQTPGDHHVYVFPDLLKHKVVVEWICGGRREFEPDDLRKAIEYVDHLLPHTEVWLNLSDTYEQPFYLNIKDGQLTANDTDRFNGSVSWSVLKKALEKALAEVTT